MALLSGVRVSRVSVGVSGAAAGAVGVMLLSRGGVRGGGGGGGEERGVLEHVELGSAVVGEEDELVGRGDFAAAGAAAAIVAAVVLLNLHEKVEFWRELHIITSQPNSQPLV